MCGSGRIAGIPRKPIVNTKYELATTAYEGRLSNRENHIRDGDPAEATTNIEQCALSFVGLQVCSFNSLFSVVPTFLSPRVTTAFSDIARPLKHLVLCAISGKMASARMVPVALTDTQRMG